METLSTNVFDDFAAAFGENPELCFNVGLIVQLRRNPPLLRAFLRWIEDSSGLSLDPATEWSIYGELPVSPRRRIFPDMVLASPALQLWFEHKLRSRLKKHELRRYLEESYLYMHGGETLPPTDPAAFSPPADARRVAVFVISGANQVIPEDLRAWREQFARLGCGFAWCGPAGYLRWPDFLPYARPALKELTGCDAVMAEHFVEWSQRAMTATASRAPEGSA